MTVVSKSSAYPATVQPGIPRLQDCPDGWITGPLSEFLYEARRPIKMADEDIYRLVKVKRARGGVVVRENLAGKNISVKSQFEIMAGDFLISKRQIVHGACGLVPAELEGSIVSNEYSVLRSNRDICLNYLNYLAHSVYFQQTCFHSSIGVHVEKMIFKLDRWLSWNFLIPPLPEQKRIAKILSTWDRAIEVVEGLIENSKAQKKALMQQLLTAKKRLPEFDGEWETYSLAELFIFKKGKGLSKGVVVANGANECILYGELYTFYSDVVRRVKSRTNSTEGVPSESGDILIPASTTTSGIDLANATAVLSDGILLSGDINILRPKFDNISPRFIARLLTHIKKFEIARMAQGITIVHLYGSHLASIKIDLPTLKEQLAISNALDAADETVTELIYYLSHLKSEKSALMQQLLTGKRRVKIDKEANA